MIAIREAIYNRLVSSFFLLTGEELEGAVHKLRRIIQDVCELGLVFIMMGNMQRRVISLWSIGESMRKLRIKWRFFNFSIIDARCPHSE